MRCRKIVFFLFIGAAIAVVAQQSVTEAPAGFTTPTLGQTIGAGGELIGTPGSQSVSNGIVEPPGDTFALIRPSSSAGTIPARDSGRCLTRPLVPNAIRMA